MTSPTMAGGRGWAWRPPDRVSPARLAGTPSMGSPRPRHFPGLTSRWAVAVQREIGPPDRCLPAPIQWGIASSHSELLSRFLARGLRTQVPISYPARGGDYLPTSQFLEKEDSMESWVENLLEALLYTVVTLGAVAIGVGVLVLLGLGLRRIALGRR